MQRSDSISSDRMTQSPPASLPRPYSFAGSMKQSVMENRQNHLGRASSLRYPLSSSRPEEHRINGQRFLSNSGMSVESDADRSQPGHSMSRPATVTVKHRDGSRYLHGASFLERLRPPVKIEEEMTPEDLFASFGFGSATTVGSHSVSKKKPPLTGDSKVTGKSKPIMKSSPSHHGSDGGTVDIASSVSDNEDGASSDDNEDELQGTVRNLRRLSILSAGSNTENDATAPLKRKSSMAQFFKNMKKEINVIKKWKGALPQVPTSQESLKKEPVGLSKFVEESNQKRQEVDRAFTRLQRTEQRFVESKQQLYLHKRMRERHHNLSIAGVMQPACALMRSLWAQFRVSADEQRRFSNAYFEPATVANYLIISREVQKYGKKTLLSDDAMRLISLRETYLKQIFHVARSQTLMSVAENDTMQESLVIELYNAVLMLRYCTCAILDVLYLMRDTESKTTILRWEGQNYVEKMQEDIAELEDTNLRYLIGKKYSFSSNPMLLPKELQLEQLRKDKAKQKELLSIVAKSKGDSMQLPDEDEPFPEDLNTSFSSMSPSAKRQSKSSMEKFGALVKPQNDSFSSTQRSVSISGLSKTGSSLQKSSEKMNTSSAGGGGVKRTKTPTVFVLREGELAPPAKKSIRSQYFEMKAKTGAMGNSQTGETRKVREDEIYKYPASIYLPKPRPAWETTGEYLMNSLDPRISILQHPYEDVTEYESMQFGRVNVPPSFIVPATDDVIDQEHKCYRMSVPVPNYTFSELHKHEVLIFGESALSKKRGAHIKLKRGLLKLRVVYRGFTSYLNTIRSKSTNNKVDLTRGVESFRDWVKEFAPEWSDDVESELDSYSSAELQAAMGMGDIDDDSDSSDDD